MLSCAGAFAENGDAAASKALRSCLSSEIGRQDGRSMANAAGQCGISALEQCFSATDFAGCLTQLTAELKIFNAKLIYEARPC